MSSLPDRNRRSRRGFALTCPESLEVRALLAAVTVDVGQVVRAVDPQLLGVNAAWWDTNLNTSQTQQMVQAAGLNLFRLPGGSSSDDFHFNAPPTYQGEGTIPSMASFIASVNGQAVVTLDYGSGSPQEAAAELAYLNAPVGPTTPIGDGQEWNDSTNAWQTVNWQNAGYWASLRAATPLPVDDGLNFLRLGRTAPFGFQYFEVGNEEYGSWEIDHHTAQHDPATYVAFAKQFQTYAATIDPSISIGIDAGCSRQLVQQLDPRRPPAIGHAGLHARFHQRPQLRPGPGQRERLDPAPGHRLRSQQPLRLGRARGRLHEPARSIPRPRPPERPAADDRVQLGLLEPGQADDQPGQRPVHGRLARRAAADAI